MTRLLFRMAPVAAQIAPVLMIAISATLPGCGPSTPPPSTDTAAPADAEAVEPSNPAVGDSASEARETAVSVVSAEEFAGVLEQHRGTVVLVDNWALWCAPCVRDFPETVELWNKYRSQGLTVISVNFDDPEEADTETRVLEFLRGKDAVFPNYISASGATEEGLTAFEISGGSLPHYKVYGRDGQVVAAFGDASAGEEYTHEDIEAAILKALAAE